MYCYIRLVDVPKRTSFNGVVNIFIAFCGCFGYVSSKIQFLRVPHKCTMLVEPDAAGGDEAQRPRVCAVFRLVDAVG